MTYAMTGYRGLGALSSTSVKAMQTAANAMLVPQGYKAINVDGVVGPLTCGAVAETAKFDGGAFLAQSQAQGLSCTKSTPPTKVAGALPTPGATPGQVIDLDAPTPAPATPSILSNVTPTTMVIAGGLVAGIIVLVYASKKKKPKTAAA